MLISGVEHYKEYKNFIRLIKTGQASAPGLALSLFVIKCDLIMQGCIHISNITALINDVLYHRVAMVRGIWININ